MTFIQNAYRRENRRAKLPNLKVRSAEQTCDQLRRAESEWGSIDFRSAVRAYLHDQSDFLKEQCWPLMVFLSQVSRYVSQAAQSAPPARTASASSTAEPFEVSSVPSSPENGSQGLKTQTSTSVLPDEA